MQPAFYGRVVMKHRMTRALSVAMYLGVSAVAMGAEPDSRRPFVIEGRSFVSQEAFIAAGLRCGTPHVDAIRAAEIDADIAARQGGRGQAKKPAPPSPPPAVTGGTIDVYVHVILAGAGGAACPGNRSTLRSTS
jgi:hypothetical protein